MIPCSSDGLIDGALFFSTASAGERRSMSLFKTWTELRQEVRYTRPKASSLNVSTAYVMKADMDLCALVGAVGSHNGALLAVCSYLT